MTATPKASAILQRSKQEQPQLRFAEAPPRWPRAPAAPAPGRLCGSSARNGEAIVEVFFPAKLKPLRRSGSQDRPMNSGFLAKTLERAGTGFEQTGVAHDVSDPPRRSDDAEVATRRAQNAQHAGVEK